MAIQKAEGGRLLGVLVYSASGEIEKDERNNSKL
jgi:hypothetical protein